MASPQQRSLWLGRWLKGTGLLLIWSSFALVIAESFSSYDVSYGVMSSAPREWLEWVEWVLRSSLLAVAPVVLFIPGAFLLYRGKQYAALARAQRALEDTRSPVLYLRPFSLDESMARQVLATFFSKETPWGIFTQEEQLADVVAPIGPLIAIGQPGERLPKPGAARAYASDAEWQAVVERWLSRARLVILRPGTSAGVWWELEQAFATVHPERILLFLQRITRARYEALAESIQARFGIALPQFEPSRFRRTASGFIEFGEGWRTRFLPLRAPFWRVSPRKKPRRLFHQALQPVFSRLGVDWRPLPISVLKVVLVALLLGSAVYTGIDFNNAVDRLMYIPAGGVRVEVPRSVAGLWLSAPGMLEPIKPRDFQERWEHLRPVAEKLESYESNTAPILVEVERVIFKPEVQLQRTEVVARALLDMKAREEGVSHFQSSTRETRVSGHPALRVSMRYTVDDQPWRLEALFLAIGQSAWSVRAVMMDSPGADVSVRRIFDSVGLAEDVADEHP